MKGILEFTYSCGHPGTAEFQGNAGERRRAIWRYEHQICPECAEKNRQEKNAEAAAANAAAGLPDLDGTERQIAWAERLRSEALEFADGMLDQCSPDDPESAAWRSAVEAAHMRFFDETSAVWFIENRGQLPVLFRKLVKRLQKDMANGAAPDVTPEHPEVFCGESEQAHADVVLMQVEDQKPGSARNVKRDSAAKGRVGTTAAHVSDAQSNARSLTAVRDGSFLQYRRRQDEKETRGKSGVMLSPARGVETNRPIDWFDIQVMAAVRSISKTEGLKSLIPGAPEGIVFTPLSVFRTLTDPAADPRRGSAILEDIEESIDTLSGIFSKYNVREELTRRGVDPGIIETFDVVQYLLPTEYIEVRIHGVACRTYQTRGTPSLFIYQDAIGQECAIDPSVRSIQKVDGNGRLLYKANKAGGEVPALISLSSRTRLAILGYLEMRVAVYKNDVRRFFEECRKAETQKAEGRKHVSTPGPVKQANKILAETLCEMCGLSAHNLQRDLAFVEDVFRYWKATGHIDGFEMRYKAQGARGQSLECVKFKWAPITE